MKKMSGEVVNDLIPNTTKQKRKKIIKATLVSLFSILIIIAMIIGFFAFNSMTAEKYETIKISEYGNYTGHIAKESDDIFSGLSIFPTKIAEGVIGAKYYYYCDNEAFYNAYKIYLECIYDANEYENEVERLSNLKMEYNGEIHSIILDQDSFRFPAYVSIFDGEVGAFEYALVDEQNKKIIYIYSQICGLDKNIIESEYLPVDSSVSDKLMASYGGYNMYYFTLSNGDIEMPKFE